MSGIIYDVYVNYLQEVCRPVAMSFWSYYGYSSFISALLLLFVPKIGYKKLLLFCAFTCTFAVFALFLSGGSFLYAFTTLLALTGLQLHYAILYPYVAAYTSKAAKISWYSKAYYIGYIGYFLSTFLGGMFTVKMFSLHGGLLYQEANKLTSFLDELSPTLRDAYLTGNRDVLLFTGIFSALAFLPVLFLREEKTDYQARQTGSQIPLREKSRMIVSSILSKSSVLYLIYWALINFGMGLFTSYYTVFLNRNLHIDKAVASYMVSFSYLALVLFLLFTPFLVKKIGQVYTLGGVSLLSIPFMLLIANGDRFGKFMIPMVTFSLFMRSGLVNLSYPVDSSLSMEIVNKELRPAYTSVINAVAGLSSIFSGWFTGNILFVDQGGYRMAYYIAAVLYTIACIILLAGLKKFNRTLESEEKE